MGHRVHLLDPLGEVPQDRLGRPLLDTPLHAQVVPGRVFDAVGERYGRPVTALVLCHCESVDSGLLDTTASKGALDRITLAAARELAHLGVTANAVNPGPVDTGWMTAGLREEMVRQTPLGRLGTPRDTAHLVDFLCSPEGQWVNGQLLMSNGGLA
ncbi:SDR family oxidoreductase [Streptomyces sp. NPDC057494]|uniref:SDR family oxidoreductase n=1 Tax=Streptomyces sp. NPDC057494 TaxID=3346148 RepID=UPI0036A95784